MSASVLTTDPWEEACQVLPNVNTLTRNAARQAYEQAGVGPEDLDLVELHDCFATAELVHYDNLMLCQEGGAVDFFAVRRHLARRLDPGQRLGRPRVQGPPHRRHRASPTSGRSATHLRGEAGDRQIADAKVGLAHVIGLGSACGVHILERAA